MAAIYVNASGNMSCLLIYYFTLTVGSITDSSLLEIHPGPYFLDVDTGSDLTWIQCDASCTNCAKVRKKFISAHQYIIRLTILSKFIALLLIEFCTAIAGTSSFI